MKQKAEIMAPAGSFESLQAALDAGADSVYFGVGQLNMRARAANNFLVDDLREIVSRCAKRQVKTYLTVNTVLYDHDVTYMKKICDEAKAANVTAVIASDISAISYANQIGLEVHISTQVNVSNLDTVKFYAKFADVIVLARELTLKQIQGICDGITNEQIKGPKGELVRIELFAHGALCVAVSGKCYMSLGTYNASANRGACLQNCRRSYKVIDEETGKELVVDNKYIMSPKDLCTIRFVDKLLDAGVSVLKLEGRGRAPEYVSVVTRVYKEAVEAYNKGETGDVAAWEKELETVYNRGFWHGGYYLGKELGEWSGSYGSQATKQKVYVGKVRNYYTDKKVVHFYLEAGAVQKGEEVLIIGPTTGVAKLSADELRVENEEVSRVSKGQDVTMGSEQKVRINDKVYVVRAA